MSETLELAAQEVAQVNSREGEELGFTFVIADAFKSPDPVGIAVIADLELAGQGATNAHPWPMRAHRGGRSTWLLNYPALARVKMAAIPAAGTLAESCQLRGRHS